MERKWSSMFLALYHGCANFVKKKIMILGFADTMANFLGPLDWIKGCPNSW